MQGIQLTATTPSAASVLVRTGAVSADFAQQGYGTGGYGTGVVVPAMGHASSSQAHKSPGSCYVNKEKNAVNHGQKSVL